MRLQMYNQNIIFFNVYAIEVFYQVTALLACLCQVSSLNHNGLPCFFCLLNKLTFFSDHM